MPVSEAQRKSNAKHDKEHFEYCTVKVKKGTKQEIKEAATLVGESINGYIIGAVKQRMLNESNLKTNRALDEAMERDNATLDIIINSPSTVDSL